LLSQMLAQQLPGEWVEQTDMGRIPLHPNTPADPAGRRSVIGGFDFHTTVQMHRALAALVITEWSRGNSSSAGRSSANIAETCRFVVP